MTIILSICIYVNNNADLIDGFLESFKNRKPSSIELVIVDDGSTDDSLIKIQSFLLNYKGKMKLLMTPSVGEIAARNKAMTFMHGQFYSFLSIYDKICLEYIEQLPDLLDESLKVYALYPSINEERVLSKPILLCYLPSLSSYIFHKDIVKEIDNDFLYPSFSMLFELLESVDEIMCLPYRYINTKKLRIESHVDTFHYLKDFLNENNKDLVVLLMIYYLLIKGLKRRVDKLTLYHLQKEIKEIEPNYLRNPYLNFLSKEELKDLKRLKRKQLFLIK